jgi:hypothetical protein
VDFNSTLNFNLNTNLVQLSVIQLSLSELQLNFVPWTNQWSKLVPFFAYKRIKHSYFWAWM